MTKSESASVSEAAAHMYSQDQASQSMGIELLEATPGHAIATMTVTENMVNGLGVCHGGLIFALADSTMGFATNANNERALATNAEVDFVNAAPLGSVLTAVATRIVHRGKQSINDVVVSLADGTVVAVFRGRTLTVGGSVL